MANVPFPLTGASMEEVRGQIYELIRQIYEEKIGGADLGDVFSIPGDVLTLVLDSSTPGLTKSGNALAVKVTSDGGLIISSLGISIKVLSTGGLQTDANGISIEALSTGGLETGSGGLAIKLDGDTLSLSTNGLKVTPSASYAMLAYLNENYLAIGSSYAYYIGNIDTNGSWRMIRSGDDLLFQRRESGNWVTKETIYASPPP